MRGSFKFLAHDILFNDYAILHRDISLNNILLFRPDSNTEAGGLLIDLDYGEEIDFIQEDDVTMMDNNMDSNAAHEGEEAQVVTDVCMEVAGNACVNLSPPSALHNESTAEGEVTAAGAGDAAGHGAAPVVEISDHVRTVRLHAIYCWQQVLIGMYLRARLRLWQ